LWGIPTIEVAVALFGLTSGLDGAAYRHNRTCPSWANRGSADVVRQIPTGTELAVIWPSPDDRADVKHGDAARQRSPRLRSASSAKKA